MNLKIKELLHTEEERFAQRSEFDNYEFIMDKYWFEFFAIKIMNFTLLFSFIILAAKDEKYFFEMVSLAFFIYLFTLVISIIRYIRLPDIFIVISNDVIYYQSEMFLHSFNYDSINRIKVTPLLPIGNLKYILILKDGYKIKIPSYFCYLKDFKKIMKDKCVEFTEYEKKENLYNEQLK